MFSIVQLITCSDELANPPSVVVAGGMGQHLKDLKDSEEQLETLIQVGSMPIEKLPR